MMIDSFYWVLDLMRKQSIQRTYLMIRLKVSHRHPVSYRVTKFIGWNFYRQRSKLSKSVGTIQELDGLTLVGNRGLELCVHIKQKIY